MKANDHPPETSDPSDVPKSPALLAVLGDIRSRELLGLGYCHAIPWLAEQPPDRWFRLKEFEDHIPSDLGSEFCAINSVDGANPGGSRGRKALAQMIAQRLVGEKVWEARVRHRGHAEYRALPVPSAPHSKTGSGNLGIRPLMFHDLIQVETMSRDASGLMPGEFCEALFSPYTRWRVVVASIGSSVVGYALGYGAYLEPKEWLSVIQQVYVLPDWRRRGVGRALVGALEQHIIATPPTGGEDYEFIFTVKVPEDHCAVLQLFAACGYETSVNRGTIWHRFHNPSISERVFVHQFKPRPTGERQDVE